MAANDVAGISGSISFSVKTYDSLCLIGTPINYPNPFKPAHGQSTTLRYTLSQDADITIMLYDITGKHIWRRSYVAGTSGGAIGQNEISWNGYTDFSNRVGNGVYIYFITSGSKVLGNGQIAVYN